MGKAKKERTEMTCDLSDVVDFIGSELSHGQEVHVMINGAMWKVLPGGPTVGFEYKGQMFTY